jgi:hypothetical protein
MALRGYGRDPRRKRVGVPALADQPSGGIDQLVGEPAAIILPLANELSPTRIAVIAKRSSVLTFFAFSADWGRSQSANRQRECQNLDLGNGLNPRSAASPPDVRLGTALPDSRDLVPRLRRAGCVKEC